MNEIKRKSRNFLKYSTENIARDGYGQIPKLVMRDKELHQTAKLIYAYFCSFGGGGNQVFPSVVTICEDLHITAHTFYKYFKQLQNSGYMVKTQLKQEGCKYSHNVYRFITEVPLKATQIVSIEGAKKKY